MTSASSDRDHTDSVNFSPSGAWMVTGSHSLCGSPLPSRNVSVASVASHRHSTLTFFGTFGSLRFFFGLGAAAWAARTSLAGCASWAVHAAFAPGTLPSARKASIAASGQRALMLV
ncbi:hypothetical protein [Streptomyces mirabilis]|uniref:hypothetical protein n=1 Tax=Streptomyces mirabilis TaxID=68239 RepID=UPI0036ED8E2E